MLQRRLDLLEQVSTLAQQLGESEDAGYTCETAGYFFLLHVLGRWERFNAAVSKAPPDDLEAVARLFPFTDFFATVPPPLFAGKSRAEDMESARVCWRHLRTMFTELQVLTQPGLLLASSIAALSMCPCITCLLYTSPSPRDRTRSRMPSSA